MSDRMSDLFANVEWWGDEDSNSALRSKPFVAGVGLVVLGVLVWYSAAVSPLPLIEDFRRIDVPFVASLYLFGVYGVAPVVARPSRVEPIWKYARQRPLVLGSLAYLVGFVVVGLLGPFFIDLSFDLDAVHQSPVFFSVPTTFTSDCVGTVVGDACAGTWAHPLGTTSIGRDVLTLALYGMREALVFATIVAALLVPSGTAVGILAGYRGDWTDEILMRVVDIQQTLPAFLIYLIASFLYGASEFLLVAVFGLTSWGGVARIVRNETLQLRREGYVTAAVGTGASTLFILRRHLLPNLSASILTAVTRQIPMLLLVEASLSYMDLTVVTTGSWGRTIRTGLNYFPEAWWVSLVPVGFLCVTVVAFSVVGDALRDVFDPRIDT